MDQKDLRVIKTKRNIEASFLKILKGKKYSEITVQNILDEALVNRSTFYKHYEDKYDLASQLASQAYQEFDAMIEKRFSVSQDEEFLALIHGIYEALAAQRDLFRSLWKIRTEKIHLEQDMAACLKKKFTVAYKPRFCGSEEEMDYLSEVYASLVMTSVKWSLDHDYTLITDVACPFIRHILTAMKELLQ